MNFSNNQIFMLILASAGTFKQRVNDALRGYRAEMAKARTYAARFKAEDEILNSQRGILIATAQEQIQKAQRMFKTDLERYCEQLSEQLQNHVSEPLDASFRDQLQTLAQFGLKPSRTQIEALLKQNNGNAIGIAALAKVLADVGSEFVVSFRDIREYEADMQLIRNLGINPIAYDLGEGIEYDSEGASLHHEAVEVMSGLERLLVRDDGSTYTAGYHWDNTSLLAARNLFENATQRIGKMQDSWVCDVTYRAAEEVASLEKPDAIESFETSTAIGESDAAAMERARDLGQKARDNSGDLRRTAKLL